MNDQHLNSVLKYQPHYTIDDYQHWEGDWEMLYGTKVAIPSPFAPHQRTVMKLAAQIHQSIAQQDCNCAVYAGLDWIVQHDTVVRPDVMLVCGEQPEKHLERPPALVIEVLSDSTAEKDVTVKRELYESQGVEHYLIVDTTTKSIRWLALQPSGTYEDISAQIPPDGRFMATLRNGCEINFDRQAALGIG